MQRRELRHAETVYTRKKRRKYKMEDQGTEWRIIFKSVLEKLDRPRILSSCGLL
jgi:hypothetical protein